MEVLAYTPMWSQAHPAGIEAAQVITDLGPGDLGTVCFVTSGSEVVEAAIKFSRQYHAAPGRTSAHQGDQPPAGVSRDDGGCVVGHRPVRDP